MQVICKHCQSVLQVDSKNHGKQTRCGNCKQAFQIVDPKQVADAKKADRLAKAKGMADNWKASIKAQLIEPGPALPKREFKKKTPVYNSYLREGGLENWLLNTARQFVMLVYVLGSAFFLFSMISSIYTGFTYVEPEIPAFELDADWKNELDADFKNEMAKLADSFRGDKSVNQIAFESAFYSLLSWIGFTIVYAVLAAPIIALIRIEKHLRVSLIREINKQQEGN